MAQYLQIAGLVVAAAVVVVSAVRQERRLVAAAVAHAAALGYHCDPSGKSPPELDFELFSDGRRKQVSFHTWKPGAEDSVFQYDFTVTSGRNTRVERRSAALVALPFDAPHLEIGPERLWASFGRAFGIRDIEVESPAFNEQYRVSCPDERFAITLLDPRMIAWLLSPASGRGSVRFEFHGPWMLCWGNRLRYEQLVALLEWSQAVRDYLPSVLASLYPTTVPR